MTIWRANRTCREAKDMGGGDELINLYSCLFANGVRGDGRRRIGINFNSETIVG